MMVTANCFHSLHGEKLFFFQECKPKHIYLLVVEFKFPFAWMAAAFPIIFHECDVQDLRLKRPG